MYVPVCVPFEELKVMTKKERQAIYDKFGGHCAYCGCILQQGWHADHVRPIRRKLKYDKSKQKMVPTGECRYPKRECSDNYYPACASCNINKHSMSIEDFRKLVSGFITSLNRDSVQYRIARRYGLLQETEKPVIFFFEQYNSEE